MDPSKSRQHGYANFFAHCHPVKFKLPQKFAAGAVMWLIGSVVEFYESQHYIKFRDSSSLFAREMKPDEEPSWPNQPLFCDLLGLKLDKDAMLKGYKERKIENYDIISGVEPQAL